MMVIRAGQFPLILSAFLLGTGVAGCSKEASTGGLDASVGASDAGTEDARAAVDAAVVPDAAVRPDSGAPVDAGGDVDAGPLAPPAQVACLAQSAAIEAATGQTIRVSSAGDGQVLVAGQMRTLRQVVSDASSGDTILLEDGTYTLPAASGGGFTGLYFTKPNVTLRSASGDAARVIIDSAYRAHGNGSAAITVAASSVVLASFTVQRSVFHLIHLWAAGDDALIHDVNLVDGGQQFLKASPGQGEYVDRAQVSCSSFVMTAEGRDNVWGYGPVDGSTRCYTGGIDTHDSRDWHIHDSFFDGIYCNSDGIARPAHGMSPGERGGQTYQGGLAEHAIHMWDSESGSGHTIERNHIVNCARGIGLGLRAEVYGTVIRNNMVFSEHPGGGEHDVGITVERAHDTQVDNNTVILTDPNAYANGIEYRWGTTSGLDIRNNLTNKRIWERNGAAAALEANVSNAELSWFVDVAGGDLHLMACDEAAVVRAGVVLASVPDDFDGAPRGTVNDVGADHCAAD